jgi:hypothetical protein
VRAKLPPESLFDSQTSLRLADRLLDEVLGQRRTFELHLTQTLQHEEFVPFAQDSLAGMLGYVRAEISNALNALDRVGAAARPPEAEPPQHPVASARIDPVPRIEEAPPALLEAVRHLCAAIEAIDGRGSASPRGASSRIER